MKLKIHPKVTPNIKSSMKNINKTPEKANLLKLTLPNMHACQNPRHTN